MDRKWRCHQGWEVVGISSMNRTCKGYSRASRAISNGGEADLVGAGKAVKFLKETHQAPAH